MPVVLDRPSISLGKTGHLGGFPGFLPLWTKQEGLPGRGRLAHIYLGPIPLLCLLHVVGGHSLVLSANLPQGSCEIWLGHIHLHMDLLLGQLLLEFSNFLIG